MSFKLNQEYIAEFLCIEREVQESTCGGCCQLKEQLKESHDTTGKLPAKIPEGQKQQLHNCRVQLISIAKRQELQILTQSIHHYSTYNSGFIFDIFHPPRVA